MSGSPRRYGQDEPNPVLSSLDPHKFTSQIPIAVNGKRRNSTTSAIGGMGLTDMINRSISKNKPEPFRRSYTDTRRSLIGDRKSLRSSQRTSLLSLTGINGTGGHNGNKDPRPLRDRNFQIILQQEIYDYLNSQKFDIDTNHPISLKSLRQPTQKDFVFMFKWLYLRMDPGYKFTKSLEHEVYSILKTIHYPYLETINKSQISAVGGSSWPKFLGMLHWLVNTNKRLDSYLLKLDMSIMNQNTQDLTVLKQPINTPDKQEEKQEKYELMVERLFIDYIVQSYKSFLQLQDDYEPYLKEMEAGFEKFSQVIETDIGSISRQNDQLSVRYHELIERGEALKTAKDKFTALQSDLTKFQNYINGMQHKSQEWPRKLQKMEEEKLNKNSQIKDMEEEIINCRELLKERNVSIDEIDKKVSEKEKISKSLELVSTQLDHLASSARSQRLAAENAYRNFLTAVDQYRSAIESFMAIRRNLGHEVESGLFQLEIPDNLLDDDKLGLDTRSVFQSGITINGSIRNSLLSLNSEIHERIENLQRVNASFETELDNLKEDINEKTKLLDALESELSSTRSDYEEYRQQSRSQLLSQRIEIEKMERKLQNAKYTSKQKLSEAEQKVQDTKLRCEELKLTLNREKANLYSKVIKVIEYVSNFKINVQSSIEDLEELTSKELSNIKSEGK
ncbi:LAFE_0F00980g1_1 [Lachancea fermentati]|uniref:Kinetochore protein NDC80 n=1 Tax=Lachancea fermentati TaxID=4955 RepID=A0A1G4ME36_LACFM|nr:LAFE_0F00980g1_1 [Lachancea fermentati]